MDHTPMAINSQYSEENHQTLQGRFSGAGTTPDPGNPMTNSNYLTTGAPAQVQGVRIGEI